MAVSVTMVSTAIFRFVQSMSILRMVGSMLANKSAILSIQQQVDTDDNADSDDDFMMMLLHKAH